MQTVIFQRIAHIICLTIFVLLFCDTNLVAQTRKSDYLQYIKIAAERAWAANPQIVEEWKRTTKPSELWGYDAPANPIYLADTLGYLYLETKERKYAEQASELLATYGDFRSILPKEFSSKRIEYSDGVPALSNFFIMPPYARAYMRIRNSGAMSAEARAKIEKDLAFSLDFIERYPEWGAHNRAMLRAESLYYGALALASHPHAKRWKQLAETLASDSMNQWEIEDATGYHGIWLYSVFSYAEISGREDVLRSPMVKYYLDYFVQLLTPHGNLADFGDAHWNGGWERFVPVYEKAATLYRNPQYKYLANELVKRAAERGAKTQNLTSIAQVNFGAGVGSPFTDAHRWADDTIQPQAPTNLSGDALEDLIGKKFVFRDGWQRDSTMLLLNYRDEGDGGLLGRDYLRQTLSVEEEKMHHGHADENSIPLLMSGGSVLLHDGGYRPDLPSGPSGEWRSDFYHNRVVARREKLGRGQSIFELMRNSGAYHRVRTQKIDFLKFKDADASRSRLIDEDFGWQWDRVITHLKAQNIFVVIDGIKILKPGYYTFTNLWHTRQVLAQDKSNYLTAYDKIATDPLPDDKRLLIHFPENGNGKQLGTYAETRHFQDETAIYQTISSSYKTGDTEFFVTLLIPQNKQVNEKSVPALPSLRVLQTDKPGQAIGLELTDRATKYTLCVKLDLEMDLARENIGPRYIYNLGKVQYGDFETDASLMIAAQNGKQLHYGAATFTKAVFRNQILHEAKQNTFGLQLDGSGSRYGIGKWRFWEGDVTLRD